MALTGVRGCGASVYALGSTFYVFTVEEVA
jgi:hypothetical protein